MSKFLDLFILLVLLFVALLVLIALGWSIAQLVLSTLSLMGIL